MAVKFSPNGFLNIAADPSELPSEVVGKDELSGAMRRCTNLHLDKQGIASTRKGSSKINDSALDETTAYNIVELGGQRNVFAGSKIYQDETEIEDELVGAKWSAIKYNPYNSESVNIFALNGEERKRISGANVYEWGMDDPDNAPVIDAESILTGLTGDYNAKYTHVRKEGTLLVSESNPSDAASAAETLSNQSLSLICHHNVDDTQHTHLRVYRTMAGGAIYYQDQDIALADYADYTYTFSWELDDEYISGTGYKITSQNDITEFEKQRYYESGTQTTYIGRYSTAIVQYQGFKPDGNFDLAVIGLELSKVGSPIAMTVSVYDTDSGTGHPGTSLGSTTVYASSVSDTNEWIYLPLNDEISLTADTLYWIVLTTGAWDGFNYYLSRGYFILGGSNQFGDSDELFGQGQTIATATHYSVYDLNFAACTVGTGLYEIIFDWEADYSTATNHKTGKNCHYHEPGLLVTNTADTSLGDELDTNHNRPPLGSFVFGPLFNGTCFIIKDNDLYYSLPKQPEHWPATYFLEVCSSHETLTAGAIYDSQVYCASTVQIYNIPGTGPSSFGFPLSMSAITGTVSAQCFLAVHGFGIFHLGNDGLYLYSAKDENITNERFKPIFDGDTVGSIPGIDSDNIANCWLIYFKSKLWFAYPESGSTYPDNFIVTDLRTGQAVHYDYDGTAFPCATVDEENDRLLALDTEGYVWQLDDPDETDDEGTDISWQIETKAYSDQLRKYFPRHARYDVTLGSGATATGYILLNGTSIQSHSLSTSRATKKRLITGGNGDRVAMRITGTGSVDIYAGEIE